MIATDTLVSFFLETRKDSEKICRPLLTEDYVVQPVDFVSPPKWHLAHTTWFFEEFILKPHKPKYQVFHEDFSYIFNSYYENVGKRVLRAHRGNLSRPEVSMIFDYRKHVTNALSDFLKDGVSKEIEALITIGIHHEKQHQELLLTDIKYILGNNPLFPVYNADFTENPVQNTEQEWISMAAGIYEIGHNNPDEFCYDNEKNRHKVYLNDYQISNKLVTNGEFIQFINDGGYDDFNLWHSDGKAWKDRTERLAPMYWHKVDNKWHYYTLAGFVEVNPDAPLSHVTYYEAFAYAQWKGCRLPTEFEWEAAQNDFNWGSRWEWTESAYLPYPGFTKATGAIGEYNGKFMVDQIVLRGKSVATPKRHSRPTYRNFFQPYLSWQYTGVRLAK